LLRGPSSSPILLHPHTDRLPLRSVHAAAFASWCCCGCCAVRFGLPSWSRPTQIREEGEDVVAFLIENGEALLSTRSGLLVEAVAVPWFVILEQLQRDPNSAYQSDSRVWEEIIAGA
jgi:hypothetical protein